MTAQWVAWRRQQGHSRPVKGRLCANAIGLLIRSAEGEKGQQIANVARWQEARNGMAPSGETSHGHFIEDAEEQQPSVRPERSPQGEVEGDGHGLGYLQQTAREKRNVFEALMEAVKTLASGRLVMRFMMWVGSIVGICSGLVFKA